MMRKLAAETVFSAISGGCEGSKELTAFTDSFKNSWLYDELYRTRNFGPAMHKFGPILGGAFNFVDQNIFGGKLPITLRDNHVDYAQLKPADQFEPISYPKPDGKISFDKLTSLSLSGTMHEENQPVHLKVNNVKIAINTNLKVYNSPEQYYCPASVYEIVTPGKTTTAADSKFSPYLQINFTNCLHCKSCDIKDPTQNINWTVPEGAGGPNYPNM